MGQVVITGGDAKTARNPSAAILSRIGKARQVSGSMSMMLGGMGGMSVEQFIFESGADDESKNQLRSCPPAIQQYVMARGEVNTARNPSATILARIREGKQQFSLMVPMGGMGKGGMRMNNMGGGCGFNYFGGGGMKRKLDQAKGGGKMTKAKFS